jgi:hypothetical protein
VRTALVEIERRLDARLGPGALERLRALLDADWGDPGKIAELD